MKKDIFIILTVISVIISACGNSGENESRTAQDPSSLSGNSSDAVTFAVFGNTGFVTDNGVELKALIRAANEHDVDFFFDLGNRLPKGVPPHGAGALWDTADEYSALFEAPVYPTVGENDVFDYESDVEYSKRFGPMWYSFKRAETLFIVLNTEDNAYRSKFGSKPDVSDEQLEWLWDTLETSGSVTSVILMNSPLWDESPEIWNERLLPIITAGNVNLIVTCFENGLYDWGKIDGIRAVSTGCAGPAKLKNPGLFPHFLLITVNDKGSSFQVLFPDGTVSTGIPIDSRKVDEFADITAPLDIQALKTDASWNISEEMNFKFVNNFDKAITGTIDFTLFPSTSWKIDPSILSFSIDPGVSKTLHLGIRGTVPELGPLPEYSAELRLGETAVYENSGYLRIKIPRPRTDEVISVSGKIAEKVPYTFDGQPLKIPIEIESIDTCGRLIIYNEEGDGIPECLYVSPLRDFGLGINVFTWNGHDLEGNIAAPAELSYKICIYTKKAPVTWVAEGPPNNNGTFAIERTLSGLKAVTHDERSIFSYRIDGSIGKPEQDELFSFGDITDGLSLTGFARDEDNRYFLGTDSGIVCVYFTNGKVRPDVSFGENGYVTFPEYRGRSIGNPEFHNGLVYIGIGGSGDMGGNSPKIIILDSESGRQLSLMDLREFYGTLRNPPSVCVTNHGIFCAHPDDDHVIMLTHYGDVQWINGPGDRIGDRDVDGRSHTWGIAADQYGFSYVNTPGYSARCGVLGPDGRGLFRVILVQLPGLRVSSVVPVIEGNPSDGLYFVTRGGDMPYVFHVPFTVKTGIIVDEKELTTE
ncbi:metallophosphoesterase family protein [Candidatus Latescibacterota bacterium]